MKNKITILFILLSITICFAQEEVTWEELSKVTFVDKYFPEYDAIFLHPTFSDSVKALEGKELTITGYFLSIDPKKKFYVLSKGPMASCFFCGVGGPETAIELQYSSDPKFKTDDIITVTGKFKLNAKDVRHFNYIFTEPKGQIVDKI
jgi:hypothetical protein